MLRETDRSSLPFSLLIVRKHTQYIVLYTDSKNNLITTVIITNHMIHRKRKLCLRKSQRSNYPPLPLSYYRETLVKKFIRAH